MLFNKGVKRIYQESNEKTEPNQTTENTQQI